MSAPQLADADTSSEWFHTVAGQGTGAQRSQSRAAIDVSQRRKRFVRLVTYTMAGLVAFTLLGVGSFAWRRHAEQASLDAPVVPALAPVARPTPIAAAAEAGLTPPAANAELSAAPAPAAAAVPHAVPKKVIAPAAKTKPANSAKHGPPFLGAKATVKARPE